MTAEQPFETLLANLKNSDYDSLISHERLRASGWKIHFVIDASIVNNYCFPTGIFLNHSTRLNDRKFTNEYLADEQATLHSLFYLTEPNNKPIIFDQYLPELRALINLARNTALYNSQLNQIDFFLDNSFSLSPTTELNEEKIVELVKENFSQIIATVLSRMDGLNKLLSLFKDKVFIFDSTDLNNQFLQDACDLVRGNVDTRTFILQLYRSLFSLEKFQKRESAKERDSWVIDRIIGLNNFIQKWGKGKDQKHLFILISDSPATKRVLDELCFSEIIEYPRIEGKKINLYRTTEQFFAHLICRKYNKKQELSSRDTINNLSILREKSFSINSKFNQTQSYLQKNISLSHSRELLYVEEYRDIFSNYREIRGAYENVGLFQSFNSFYNNLIGQINTETKFRDIKRLLDTIKKQIDVISNELANVQNIILDDLETEAEFNSIFIMSIETIKNELNNFDLSKGGDPIEGSYQHLPVFLHFSDGDERKEYHEIILKLTRMILERKINESKLIFIEFDALLRKLYTIKSKVQSPTEEKLIKSFISLILPPIDSYEHNEEYDVTDMKAYKWLRDVEKRNTEPTLESEILYMLCWTARRTKDYISSEQFAKRGIKKFPKDPRFFHGYALALYGEKEDIEKETVSDVNEIIENLQKAYKLYPDFLKDSYSSADCVLFLNKVDQCFDNNFCFFYTEIAHLLFLKKQPQEQSLSYIKLAEINLNRLRVGGGFIEELAEYYDTEAYFYFVQSLLKKYFNPLQKVLAAKKSIDTAIQLTSDRRLITKYEKRKRVIETRLSELNKDS